MKLHTLGDSLKWTWIPTTCSGCLLFQMTYSHIWKKLTWPSKYLPQRTSKDKHKNKNNNNKLFRLPAGHPYISKHVTQLNTCFYHFFANLSDTFVRKCLHSMSSWVTFLNQNICLIPNLFPPCFWNDHLPLLRTVLHITPIISDVHLVGNHLFISQRKFRITFMLFCPTIL